MVSQSGNIPRPMEGVSHSGPGADDNLGGGAAAAANVADGSFLGDDTSSRDARFKTPKSVPPTAQQSASQRRSRSGTRTTSRSRSRAKSDS